MCACLVDVLKFFLLSAQTRFFPFFALHGCTGDVLCGSGTPESCFCVVLSGRKVFGAEERLDFLFIDLVNLRTYDHGDTHKDEQGSDLERNFLAAFHVPLLLSLLAESRHAEVNHHLVPVRHQDLERPQHLGASLTIAGHVDMNRVIVVRALRVRLQLSDLFHLLPCRLLVEIGHLRLSLFLTCCQFTDQQTAPQFVHRSFELAV